MNDKDEMEAAREAALQDGIKAFRHIFTPEQVLVVGRGFFEAGYNAAQPKPCVWTYHENHRFLTTSCGFTGFTVYVAGAAWCRFCGGKIEKNESIS